MRRTLLVIFAALGIGGFSEARATDVYAVVGTLGYDLQRDSIPLIDFAIGEQCVYQELGIAEVVELVEQGVGPAVLEPGAYEAAVLEAGDGECSGAPLVTGRADVPASPLPGATAANVATLVVAALDANGAPKLRTFNLDTAALGGRRSRVTFFHSAAAPALDLRLRRAGRSGNAFAGTGLDNGAQTFPTELLGADYELLVSPASPKPGAFEEPFARVELPLQGGQSHAVVLIGSLERRTFDLVVLKAPTAP
jgi:hypothetical protein